MLRDFCNEVRSLGILRKEIIKFLSDVFFGVLLKMILTEFLFYF